MRERFILQGLVMLIAFTLSLATPFKAHAQSGQKERITIMVKQKPLEEVLKKLSKEYNYQLFYNNSLVKGIRVSVSIQKAGINQTMDVLLAGTGLQYSIKEKTIVITTIPSRNTAKEKKLLSNRAIPSYLSFYKYVFKLLNLPRIFLLLG